MAPMFPVWPGAYNGDRGPSGHCIRREPPVRGGAERRLVDSRSVLEMMVHARSLRMRVLVVEDYTPLRSAIVAGLREDDYAVDATGDGQEALWYAESNAYDALVLDLMLPGLDGLSILRRLRQTKRPAPVLILTAKDTVEDRVTGLDAGADDYLVKPFALPELFARVRALVRRGYGVHDAVLRVGDLQVDTRAKRVVRRDVEVELTAREYALLELLALRAGAVVSRAEIWEHLYDFGEETQSNVVDVYIGYLRRKLDRPGWPALIQTRRGQGYLLNAGRDASV